MRNQDRLSPPYVLGTVSAGLITAGGLAISAAPSSTLSDQTVVAIRTNGGAVLALPAPYATASAPAPEPDPEEED